jgi:hypothetical protein
MLNRPFSNWTERTRRLSTNDGGSLLGKARDDTVSLELGGRQAAGRLARARRDKKRGVPAVGRLRRHGDDDQEL